MCLTKILFPYYWSPFCTLKHQNHFSFPPGNMAPGRDLTCWVSPNDVTGSREQRTPESPSFARMGNRGLHVGQSDSGPVCAQPQAKNGFYILKGLFKKVTKTV